MSEEVKKLTEWFLKVNEPMNPKKFLPRASCEIINVKNLLIKLSYEFRKDSYLHNQIFSLKDSLFNPDATINSWAFGQLFEIIMQINSGVYVKSDNWEIIHPLILKASKGLYDDGHYANAAENAFIEINSRVKKLFHIVRPNEPIPDGDKAMTTTFSVNKPVIQFCDLTDSTGFNIQKGFMEMLAGAMSAFRNPKAHDNITLLEEESMRRLMFASSLMYQIDEAVNYSKISEG